MSKLRIDCGHGVTEIVNVAPNSTLGEVLGEVCTRRKLEPSGHALRHTLGGKKDNLDGSLSFRLSGLSNNAKLELVAAANRLAASGECTLGLQLEDGSRKMAKVDSSSSLSEVIAQLAPEVAHPVVQYMGRTVANGALASTTLFSLGVTRGASALLRVSSGPASSAADTSMTDSYSRVEALSMGAPVGAAMGAPKNSPVDAAMGAAGMAAMPAATASSAEDAAMGAAVGAHEPLASMLQEAIEIMRGAFVDAASYSAALSLLYKYCANILSNPSEDKFRVIKKSNTRFQNAIGQHAAARQVLRAVGFVEISAGAASECV